MRFEGAINRERPGRWILSPIASAKIGPIPLRGGAENIQSLARNTLFAYRAEVRQSAISAYISVVTDHKQFPRRDLRGTKLPQLRGRVSDMLNVWLFELVTVHKKHIILALYCVATYSRHSLKEKQTILMKNHDVVRPWDRLRVRRVEKSIGMGSARAMVALGGLYRDGKGVPQDYQQASVLFEKAAAQGYVGGLVSLADLYHTGPGVEQDFKKAKKLYEQAAAAGSANAMNNIGFLFEYGQGVPQDYEQARQWYEKAVEAGSPCAMSNLGRMYQSGHGVKPDQKQAQQLFDKAKAIGTCGM